MSAQDYLEGAALFAVMLAATTGGALVLVRRRLPSLRGAEWLTAYGLLTTVAILAVHLVPAMLGILGRGSVIVASLVWVVACCLVRPVQVQGPASQPEAGDPDGRISWPLALILAGAVVVYALAFFRNRLVVPPTGIDFMAFHMPTVVEWIQTGSIWEVFSALPSVAPGNYPNNGDVLFLAAALPWHNDFLVRLPMFALHLLTGVAVYALARRLRARRAAALVGASLVLVIPVVARSALDITITDSAMYFGFAAGALFLVRHHQRGSTADLVLAGLALGFSFGAKWYGVSAVAVVMVVWASAALIARRTVRRVLVQGAALCGLIALLGGVWLLRNWIEAGNPVFPARVSVLGTTLFDAPPDLVREQIGFTLVDYVDQPAVWREFMLPQYRDSLAAPGALILLGAALAAMLSLRPGRARGLALRASVVCVVLLLAVYAVLPYTAGGLEGTPDLVGVSSRYAIPALLIGAALAAWATGTWRWGAGVFAALGLLVAAHGMERTGALRPSDWAVAVIVAGAIGLTARQVVWRSARGGRRWLRPGLVALVAAFAVGALALGYEVQKRFNDGRYLGADPTVDFILTEAGAGQRIGLAGLWTVRGISPVLPAYGPRYENDVEYVGPLVEGFRRRYADRGDFVAALDRGDYDFLIVGRDSGPFPTAADEARWAGDAGFELVARSDRLELYRAPDPGPGG